MTRPNKLIINADDFGYSIVVNRAILQSFQRSLISSTSLMANMPGFEDAVSLVHTHSFLRDHIGLHLNLTEGYPLTTSIRSCPTFCDAAGQFTYDRKRSLFHLNREESGYVYAEMKAQIERLLAAGIQPTHLDSHHHVHTEWALAPLVCRLARTYNISRVRLTRNIGQGMQPSKILYKLLLNRWRLNQRGLVNTDYFGDIADMKWMLKTRHPEGKTIEIMVHPLFDEANRLIDIDRSSLQQRVSSILESIIAIPYSPRELQTL